MIDQMERCYMMIFTRCFVVFCAKSVISILPKHCLMKEDFLIVLVMPTILEVLTVVPGPFLTTQAQRVERKRKAL